ncbi:hypothetical protein FBU31_003584 [Coemansia sp. 'formosensis']|nr:hypothetical protein FBU31_003584 [Coemansia sp. 'formosensis']
MTRGGGRRRTRHRAPGKALASKLASAAAEHGQHSATSGSHGPGTAGREAECATMVRELADTLYADLGQILLREYGKTSEQMAMHSDNNNSAAANRAAVLRAKDVAIPEERNPAGDLSDLQLACNGLEEENRRLHAQLAEREAESEGLRQQVAVQRHEIEVARRRAARLDAHIASEARTYMDQPMTLAEIRVAFRGLYKQYMLREEHFIVVERAASLESQLWREKCMRAEMRESAHIDNLRDLRQSVETLTQQRLAQNPHNEALRQRLEQCQTLVQAVSAETTAMRADYTAKMQSMDQHVRLMSRDRMEMDSKLRSTQADNQRLDEACKELQVKWQQQAWELHSSKRMLEDRLQGASGADMTSYEAAMRHTAAAAAATLFGGEGATMSGASVQSSMSPPRVIRMPRRPRHYTNRRESALQAVSTAAMRRESALQVVSTATTRRESALQVVSTATTGDKGGQPLPLPDQRDSVGTPSAQPRLHAPASADFTFSLPHLQRSSQALAPYDSHPQGGYA